MQRLGRPALSILFTSGKLCAISSEVLALHHPLLTTCGCMMTFDNLHRDLDCDCLADSSIIENTSDAFVRWVKAPPPTLEDFKSLYEEDAKLKADDCDYLCKHRGVSVHKADQESEPAIKAQWAEYSRFRPRLPRTFCKFRLKGGAGKVWKTPTRTFPYHYTLLKSDQFCMELVSLIEVSPL